MKPFIPLTSIDMKTNFFLTFFSVLISLFSFSANRYWVGGTGNWSDVNHWSTASNGAPGASVPTVADNAIFDLNSGLTSIATTVTLDVALSVSDFDFATVPNAFTISSVLTSIEIRGSLLSNGLASILYTGDIVMTSASCHR